MNSSGKPLVDYYVQYLYSKAYERSRTLPWLTCNGIINLYWVKIIIIIIIIIIMKIIYIAPNPLKGSRRFTKSVTATLQFT